MDTKADANMYVKLRGLQYYDYIDKKYNIEKCKEFESLSDEYMFSSYLDLESMEPEGWDFNYDDWRIEFKGKLRFALEDLHEARGLNHKYERLLAKSNEENEKLEIQFEEIK